MKNIVLAKELKNSVIESLIDGEGVRLVIFLCGCPHKCKGCHNAITWDIRKGVTVPIKEVLDYLISKLNKGKFSGVTFSGGDPLYQAEALKSLVSQLREVKPELNIWVYTGYKYEDIKEFPVIKLIDILVDGKFEIDKKFPNKKFRGSYNQRILKLKNGEITREE